MSKQAECTFDVFISYNHTDQAWVKGWLLPSCCLSVKPSSNEKNLLPMYLFRPRSLLPPAH